MIEGERTMLVDFPSWKVVEVKTREGKIFIEIEQSVHPNCKYYVTEEYTDEKTGQAYKRKICDI